MFKVTFLPQFTNIPLTWEFVSKEHALEAFDMLYNDAKIDWVKVG